VVHRAAELRMRMQHDADRRVFLLGRMITAFYAASRTCEDDFRHCRFTSIQPNAEPLSPKMGILDALGDRT